VDFARQAKQPARVFYWQLHPQGKLEDMTEPKKKLGGARAGAGRPKGAPNKINGELKEMILGALERAGGVTYLTSQAKKNPKAFLALLGKVLPMTIAGDPNAPVKLVVSWEK
jgi:hypothetical protein